MKSKRLWKLIFAVFLAVSVLALIRPEGKKESAAASADLKQEIRKEENQEWRTYVDDAGVVTVASDKGYATLHRVKDANGKVMLERFLDAAGEPVSGSGQYHAIQYTRSEGELWISYLDTRMEPVMTSSGYSRIHRTLTPEGKAERDAYYDDQGLPTMCNGGYYGYRRSYDSQGRIQGLTYLDAGGDPMAIKAGYVQEFRVLDEAGAIAERHYQDAAGKPMAAGLGQFGERYLRDDTGRIVEITYLDAQGNPAPVREGYTILRRSYTSGGKLYEEKYYDAAGNPVALAKGQYGIRHTGGTPLQLGKSGTLMLSVDNLLAGYPLLVVMVGLLLCVLLCFLPKKLRALLLGAYVLFIFYETLMFRETGNLRIDPIPFSYVRQFWKSYAVRSEVINNVWLFVPLGAGLYTFCSRKRILWIPFLLTVGIELTQYLTGLGFAQADDILGNTFGGVLGFLLADFLYSLFHKRQPPREEAE